MLRFQWNLNKQNFSSERWFIELLQANDIGGCERNKPLIGRFWGDFVWEKYKLIVEIDGNSHDGREEKDEMRDALLIFHGYRVLRITVNDLGGVFDFVTEWKSRSKNQEFPIICPTDEC